MSAAMYMHTYNDFVGDELIKEFFLLFGCKIRPDHKIVNLKHFLDKGKSDFFKALEIYKEYEAKGWQFEKEIVITPKPRNIDVEGF